MFRRFIHGLVLFGLLMGFAAPAARAQSGIVNGWWVTHDWKLTSTAQLLEGTRAGLESNIASSNSTQATIWSTSVGTETYEWMRAYSGFLRELRMLLYMKNYVATMKIPAWTLFPRIGFTAPVAYTDPSGNKLVVDKEVGSLSVVPPGYAAHWQISDYMQDDEAMGASDIYGTPNKSFITFTYPHNASGVNFALSPSPFLDDYGYSESDSVDEMKAHFYEALLDAAARLRGFGVAINPQVTKSGQVVLDGRMTPSQIKYQAMLLQDQATSLMSQLFNLYINHGVSFTVAARAMKYQHDYWDGFGDRMNVAGSARAGLAMNMFNEIHETIGRLEAYTRRTKIGETEDMLQHLGQKKNADGTWAGFVDNPDNFWDWVDKVTNQPNQGGAIKLQAEGLSARYSRFTYDEAEGLRNILMGSDRMDVALKGAAVQDKIMRDIQTMDDGATDIQTANMLLQKRTDIQNGMNAVGWGSLTDIQKTAAGGL